MRTFYSILILVTIATSISAQDMVVLNNGDKILGDFKSLDNGVLEIEPDYSEANFLIDWESVVELKTKDMYIVHLASGDKLNGRIDFKNGIISIVTEDSTMTEYPYLDIVYLKSVSSGFWDRMSISLDGGYTFSKASNNEQFTLRGNAAYMTTRINPDIYFNLVTSSIDDDAGVPVETDRHNWGANFRYFFTGSWFGALGADYLISDEQQLDLRSTYTLALGYYPIRNSKMYLSSAAGVAQNEETYDDELTEDGSSTEAFASLNFNAFGLKDFSITSSIQYFPSLTESGRHRVNYGIDFKFDLPRDFYIGAGYTLNYDSTPAVEGTSTTDYVFQTTIGWSL
ncbi:MAG: DUF481 domain-containing protein [Reichenbachiella sp.]